jgi:glycosyltransferase involved in cell wall biosynthesis
MMTDPLIISVITPSYNSAKFLENAVQSVLLQGYPDFEHIIVDAGSTDGTLEILKKYDHLKWVSEPDEGQSDAMNKGFRMSSGDIVVYLNADDYFLPGAFNKVLPYFLKGAKFVVGLVRVEKEDGTFWINDPKITHDEMLWHWKSNSFCVNPVGYFYLREVQENLPGFNHENNLAMDLEFLLECSLRYNFTKIREKDPLGVFRYYQGTKTVESVKSPARLYSCSNFSFIDKFLENKPTPFVKRYNRLRKEAYRELIWNAESENQKYKIRYFNRIIKEFINNNIFKLKDFIKSGNKSKIIKEFFTRNLTKS